MEKIYLVKVAFVGMIEKYNSIEGDTEYKDGIKHGLEEGIRELSNALNISISFKNNKVDYEQIPL